MEYFQELRDKARQKIRTADHMLTVTYPLVKDPKLLLAVLENVSEGLELGITSVLEHERLFKRVPPFGNNFTIKFGLFKQKIMHKHNLDPQNLRTIIEVREIIHNHKRSMVEFIRKDKFVMSDDNYNLKTLDNAKIKNLLLRSKVFIDQLYNITTKNDAMFG